MPHLFKRGSAPSFLLVLLLVLGVVLGLIASRLPTLKSQGLTCPCSASGLTTKAVDFRTGLDGNYRENLVLVLAAARRVYDADPNAADAVKALDDNAWDLGYFLKNFYDADTGIRFTKLWQEQNKALLDYTTALRNQDASAKVAANGEINRYLDDKITFWKNTGLKLDFALFQRLAQTRLDSVKAAIEAYAQHNAAKSFNEQHAAYQQTGQLVDILSTAIINQMPQKFNSQ